MAEIDQILDFCFADGAVGNWFTKDPAFDRRVKARLLADHQRAAAGDLDFWQDSAKGCLALCILLDQVPRNLFRSDPRSYATDAKARSVSHQALDRGFDQDLPQIQRLFLYLPLEHSEDLAEQQLSVQLIRKLAQDAGWLDYALRHRDIVARFGRFPHRNAILGRATTAEEVAFLSQEGSSF